MDGRDNLRRKNSKDAFFVHFLNHNKYLLGCNSL